MTTLQRLARIHNRTTLYELVATDGSQKILAGYCRQGRRGLLSMLSQNGEAWVTLTGYLEITFADKAADGATMGPWSFRFSGRTQREAICEGELPFILDL